MLYFYETHALTPGLVCVVFKFCVVQKFVKCHEVRCQFPSLRVGKEKG